MVPFFGEVQVNARFRRKADGIPNVSSHADVLEKTPTLGSAFQSFYQFKKQDRARKCLSELFDCADDRGGIAVEIAIGSIDLSNRDAHHDRSCTIRLIRAIRGRFVGRVRLRYILLRHPAEGSHNGSAAVLKTAGRKAMQVRVLSPPPLLINNLPLLL